MLLWNYRHIVDQTQFYLSLDNQFHGIPYFKSGVSLRKLDLNEKLF